MAKHTREGEISAALRACAGRLIDLADRESRNRVPIMATAEDYEWLADTLMSVGAAIDPLFETFAIEAELDGPDMLAAQTVVTAQLAGELEYVIRQKAEECDSDGFDMLREHGTLRVGAL